MAITQHIQETVIEALTNLYDQEFTPKDFQISQTKPEFQGDYTVVLFALVKRTRRSPDALGNELGNHLIEKQSHLFSAFNIIKGFLNLTVSDAYWLDILTKQYNDPRYGHQPPNGKRVIMEYSSPNTNKPLHLGHLRNNFLGWSVAEILKASGYDVIKSCIVNDRGMHICKSMLAWQKHANGATPASTGIKGDHFVGDYYVKFENDLRAETAPVLDNIYNHHLSAFTTEDTAKLKGMLGALEKATHNNDNEKIDKIKDDIIEIARNNTPIMQEVKHMLRQWEAGDTEVYALWEKMNNWVYEGFNVTYKLIGTDFDKIYYESSTYLLGKVYVEQGLQNGTFFRKEDGSVWIDLTAHGLDEKLVLRKDGTSVYITQDIGLAKLKYDDFKYNQSIYVIADEQNYHMRVLQLICQKLGLPSADGIFHLSYGMVELPSGRMKSREGTVVDADDLVAEMIALAEAKTKEQGKTEGFTSDELQDLYNLIGLGGLKFFLLRVDPKKRMVFNPEESIDLHGYTAAFVQYAHARIKSILRKENTGEEPASAATYTGIPLLPLEKELLIALEQYPTTIATAAADHDPSLLASYTFQLAQTFNSFYNIHSITNAESIEKKNFRLHLIQMTANAIASAMHLLGIRVPERM